ncbi:MAG: DUF2079 domain-containing protein [Actinobacteria bacterium]|nr:DUF2079 domain-containing protein [Actinomycetota bacterium]
MRPGTVAARLRTFASPTSDHADRFIALGATLAVSAGLYFLSWLKADELADAGYDHGYFNQAIWLINHGHPLFSSIRGLHVLADHASPILYPMAWVARWIPFADPLMLLQAGSFGLAAGLLYRFCRDHAGLSRLPAITVVAAFAAYPALHNTVLSGFHPEVVALPGLIAATYYGLAGRWLPYAACLAVVFTSKEDMAIAGMSLALLLFVRGRRTAAAITFATGGAYLAFAVGWLSPHFSDSHFTQTIRFAAYGDGIGEVVRFMVTHPGRVWTDIVGPDTITKATALLGPLLFLPLLSLDYLFPALPLEFVLLATNYGPSRSIDFHYTVAFTAFAFMATAMSLSRLRPGGLPGRRLIPVLLVATGFFFVQYAKDSPVDHPWRWHRNDAGNEARLAAHRMIPRHAAVAVSNGLIDLFSDRQFVYNAPMPFEYWTELRSDPIRQQERRRIVDWAVIDTRNESPWVFPKSAAEVVDEVLPSWGFEVYSDRAGIVVLKRVTRPDAASPIAPPDRTR